MNDLRDRIANIIIDNYPGEHNGGLHIEGAIGLAEALIQGLHMHEEHGRLKVTRYVTDWYIDA